MVTLIYSIHLPEPVDRVRGLSCEADVKIEPLMRTRPEYGRNVRGIEPGADAQLGVVAASVHQMRTKERWSHRRRHFRQFLGMRIEIGSNL